MAPPLYKSTSRIVIDKSVNRYLQTNKIVDDPVIDDGEVGSQIYILTSESIVLKIIRTLNLTRDPEFVGTGVPTNDQSIVFAKLKSFLKLIVGVRQPDRPMDSDTLLERKAVDIFSRRLNVFRGDVQNIIEVSFSSEDPGKAARIANAVVDAYIEGSLEAKIASTQMAGRLLQGRLIELKAKISDADDLLYNYKRLDYTELTLLYNLSVQTMSHSFGDRITIRTVCSLTGVNAVTLRAWERRYGFIRPLRTMSGSLSESKRIVNHIENC